MVAESEFSTIEAAQIFLARNLPLATAANPRYRSGDPGVLTAWITRAIAFAPGSDGLRVAMGEAVLEFRHGQQSKTGSHDSQFSLGDVVISETKSGDSLTESGEPAAGVLFRCKSGTCIAARYDGAPSQTDWTDISIQDDATRERVLSAFLALQRLSGGAAAP